MLSVVSVANAESHIRLNQVGYFLKGPKIAIIGSNQDLEGQNYFIKDAESQLMVKSGIIGGTQRGRGPETPFIYNFVINFGFK